MEGQRWIPRACLTLGLLLSAVTGAAGGCVSAAQHCSDTADCNLKDGGASSDATSDRATDGNDGAPVCPADYGNCDGTASNGCETDLRTDLRHCGACRAACDGVCRASRCAAFQLLAPSEETSAIALAGDHVYWLEGDSSSGTLGSSTVRKTTKRPGGEVMTLATIEYRHQLVVGAQQLFIGGQVDSVYSVNFDGTGLKTAVGYAGAIAYANQTLYWAESYNGAVYIKSLNTVSTSTTTLWELGDPTWSGEGVAQSIAVDGNHVIYGEIKSHTIRSTADNSRAIASFTGDLRRLRKAAALFWADDAGMWRKESTGPPVELSGNANADGAIPDTYVRDFAVTSTGDVYYTWADNVARDEKISRVPRGSARPSETYAWCAYALEVDDAYLYLADCAGRLVRLPLD